MAINYTEAINLNQKNQLVLNKLLENTGKINSIQNNEDELSQMVSFLSTKENQENYKKYLEKIEIFLIEHDLINLYKKSHLNLKVFSLTVASFATKLFKKDYQPLIDKKIKIKDELNKLQTNNGTAFIDDKKMSLGLNFNHLGDNFSEKDQYNFLYWHELGHILQFQGVFLSKAPASSNESTANFQKSSTFTQEKELNSDLEKPIINPLVNNDLKSNMFYDANASIIQNNMLNIFLNELKNNLEEYTKNYSNPELEFLHRSFESLPKEIYADTYSLLMLGLQEPKEFDNYLKLVFDFRFQSFVSKEKYLYEDGIEESKSNFEFKKVEMIQLAQQNPKHHVFFMHNTSYGLLALKDTLAKYNLSEPSKWESIMDFSIVDLICKEVATIGYARQILLTLACNDYLAKPFKQLVNNCETFLYEKFKENNFDEKYLKEHYWLKTQEKNNVDNSQNSYNDFIQYIQKIAKPDWVKENFENLGKEHFYHIYKKEYEKINSTAKLTYYKQNDSLHNGYVLSDKRKYFKTHNNLSHLDKADSKINFK